MDLLHGFASWYVLQHYFPTNEFIPFVDYIILEVPFTGSVNDEKKIYEDNIFTNDFAYNINNIVR